MSPDKKPRSSRKSRPKFEVPLETPGSAGWVYKGEPASGAAHAPAAPPRQDERKAATDRIALFSAGAEVLALSLATVGGMFFVALTLASAPMGLGRKLLGR